jgi:plasmid stabilization system protein ParE
MTEIDRAPLVPIHYSQAAKQDARAARLWLEGVSPGLGTAFIQELDRLGSHIQRHPEMFQRFRGECRRAVLHRFDYAMVYRLLSESIQVIGVLHCRLNPAVLLSRSDFDE